MKTLDEIAVHHGTDKGSSHPYKGHNYAVHYAMVFDPIRDKPLKVCEVGVGGAESIKTWLEYFPNARVFGVDIVHDTNPFNTPGSTPDPRYTFNAADQSDETFWKCFVATYGPDWDIFIDDGSHMAWHVIPTFRMMWPHIKRGGWYAIEDIGVCYSDASVFCNADWRQVDLVKNAIDEINTNQNSIFRMLCANELALFQKG